MANSGKFDELMRRGLGLHQAGRVVEAEAVYRRVLAKLPSHPAANHLLGVVYLNSGQPQDAIAHIGRAVHVRPEDADYRNNLGLALNAAGRSEEAVAELDRAIALRPGYAAAMNNRGLALKALGRHGDAAASFEAALKIAPTEAGFLSNLGNALAETGDYLGAETSYRRAIAVRPWHVAATAGLCSVLELSGRRDQAIALATEAVAARPQQPEFLRALGNANRMAARPEAAAESYRRLLAVLPDDAEAHRLLGSVVRRTAIDGEVRAVEALLARSDLADRSRAELEFALGQAHDDVGAFEEAFAHFSRGNALSRVARPFDLARARAEVDAIRRTFERMPAENLPALQRPTGPVLIVGLPRSGKSSLEGMLARHPDFFAADELPYLGQQFPDRAALHALAPEQFSARGSAFAEAVARLAPGRRVIDTMPNNFLLVGALRLALPSARVISSSRERLEHAAALFQKFFAKGGNEYASDLADIGAYLDLYDKLTGFWAALYPDFVRPADMASIRSDPEREMRQLLAFVGANWDPACALPHESEPRVGGRPLRTESELRLILAPYAAGLRGASKGRRTAEN